MSRTTTTTGRSSSTQTSQSEDTGQQVQKFVFDAEGVSSQWIYPEMAEVVCALCGKRCKEKGIPLCVNGNPYCG